MTQTPAQTPEDARHAPNEADSGRYTNPPGNGPQTGAEALAVWRAAGGERGPVLDPLTKAAAHPTSRSLAIAAKCYDCQGGDTDPAWRWRIGNCDAPCPLIPVRPHQHLAGKPMPTCLADHTQATLVNQEHS